MNSRHRGPGTDAARQRGLRQILFADVRAGELPGSLGRDFRELYGFYLDDEDRANLASMGRVRRAFKVVVWLLRSLLLKLTPSRRMMLLASVLLFVLDSTGVHVMGIPGVSLNIWPWSFLVLLVVLMLELKDKLLARDEIEVARQVQLALLPRTHPQPSGWTIWSHTRSANDVGGDLVDSIVLEAGSVDVALGDVAGKGLGAALLMAKLQATLRALAPQCSSLVQLGNRVNTILYRDGLDNRFATLFYMRFEPGSPRVRYLNAGHNPAFLVRAAGLRPLPATSLPLGMFSEGGCGEQTFALEPGDLVVVYSDGLVEARGRGEEEFGVERLRRLLTDLRGMGALEGGSRLLEAVDRFLGRERLHDDLSLVIADWRGTA